MDALRIQELDPNKVYLIYIPTIGNDRIFSHNIECLKERLESFGITKVIFLPYSNNEIRVEEKLDNEVEEHWYDLQNS